MRKFDYDNIAYFRMVGNAMDNGGKGSISNGEIMICVPVGICDLDCGDVVVAKAYGKLLVGIVDNIEKGKITLSRYNPHFGAVSIPTRLSKFYLVLETRYKKAAAYDGLIFNLQIGIA